MSSRTEWSARMTKSMHHTPPRPNWSPCVAVLSREAARCNNFGAGMSAAARCRAAVSPDCPWGLRLLTLTFRCATHKRHALLAEGVGCAAGRPGVLVDRGGLGVEDRARGCGRAACGCSHGDARD